MALEKADLKTSLAQTLGLAETTIAPGTVLQAYNNHEAVVEGYSSVLEYSDSVIRLSCNGFVMRFSGSVLQIKAMTRGSLTVSGHITAIEFIS